MKDRMAVVIFLIALGLAGILLVKLAPRRVAPVASVEKGVAVVAAQTPQTTEVRSGDGSVSLIKTETQVEGAVNYTLRAKTTEGEKMVYERSMGLGESIVVPANSWSPDNKLFFVEEKTGGNVSYRVFKASGEAFSGGQKDLDISDYWMSSKQKNKINEVTGWASNDLLVVTTTREDGSVGASFWFVVSSHNFMQLRSF